MKITKSIITTVFVMLLSIVATTAMAQTIGTPQTKKQNLELVAGTVLQNGTVYVVTSTGSITGDVSFPNALAVAEGATATLYIPAGVTLTVTGANANGQVGAGCGILVPATSILYITGEGTLIAQGGNAANGGDGQNGVSGTTSGQTATSGSGGDGGYGGGGGAAAIGGNGGNGGDITAGGISLSARKGSDGQNGLPQFPESTDCNGKDGSAGTTMGNVYILGKVKVETTAGSNGTAGGKAGYHGVAADKASNVTIYAGAGGAGAGGGAGYGAVYGIGGGGAGAGGGAAGGSGAADNGTKGSTDPNSFGHGSSASGYGEGSVNGAVNDNTDSNGKTCNRDEGAAADGTFKRYGGYGGSIGGKAGAAGGDGAVMIAPGNTADLTGATIGNLVTMSEVQATAGMEALKVEIKLNFLNDKTPSSGILTTKFGEYYPSLPEELIPTRPGYDFMGYYTKANGGGTKMYNNDGTPVNTSARCEYVQSEAPTFYAHWVLSTYTITWKYKYYSVDAGDYVSIPEANRSYQANVIIRLSDGTTHTLVMTNPDKSLDQNTLTVTLKNVLSTDIFNKIISVDKVEPVNVGGQSSKDQAYISLDYVTESSATIFYDPTRYMVKWSIDVNSSEKPEYVIVNVKRGTTQATANNSITDSDEAETEYKNVRIRINSNGTYDGSAVLKFEESAGNTFYYSVDVVGVRDLSGHEFMFDTPVSSFSETKGIMYCHKPTGDNTPSPTPDHISLTVNLSKLSFDPNNGILNDGTPENIWAPANSDITLNYTATRLNYNFEGWAETNNATVGLEKITLNADQTVYAVFMDRTPPTITFGTFVVVNAAQNRYSVPVTISDAISERNTMYYAVYDNNPGDIDVNDAIWNDNTKVQKGTLNKKSETASINFATQSAVYVHVKAVDASGNAAVASTVILVDAQAPVIMAYPNVDVFCAQNVDIDVTDNVGLNTLEVTNFNVGTFSGTLKSFTLPKPASGSIDYVITTTDIAGNKTERIITIYAEHDWDHGTDVTAKEPTETNKGEYRYRKCAHCSHIILLRGNKEDIIDRTNEEQLARLQIPAGTVMVMEPWNGGLDIVENAPTVNEALTKTNSLSNATQVRLSKDTQLASTNNTASLFKPNRSIDLDLNGHGLLIFTPAKGNNPATTAPGNITGNDNVTILLKDGNNHKTDYITDDIPYSNMSPVTGSPIKYTRTFSAIQGGKWQSLYLPFEAKKPADAQIGTVNYVEIDNIYAKLWIDTWESNLSAFKPYFIQHAAGDLVIEAANTTLPAYKKDAEAAISGCDYTIAGSLKSTDRVSTKTMNFWSLTNGGDFSWVKVGVGQRPYRWVIYGDPHDAINTKGMVMSLYVLEPDTNPTGVQSINAAETGADVYTISGMKVTRNGKLARGLYISNGKKFYVK